jgi:hypothetical protein
MATLFVKKKQPDGSNVVVPIKVEVRGTGVVVQSWEQTRISRIKRKR